MNNIPLNAYTMTCFFASLLSVLGFPVVQTTGRKESSCQCRSCRRHGFNLCVEKIPWKRKWQPTPVFLPGKPHGQRSLVGYSPWDHKELAKTEPLISHTSTLKSERSLTSLFLLCNNCAEPCSCLHSPEPWTLSPTWRDWCAVPSIPSPCPGICLPKKAIRHDCRASLICFYSFGNQTHVLPVVKYVQFYTLLSED